MLTEHFDALKWEKDKFERLGLCHELHADGSRSVNQEYYVSGLAFRNEEVCRACPAERLGETLKSQYLSLLGGVAWVVQTRPDIALFVSALQRKLQAPCGKDVVSLTRVLAYVKSKPMKMTFHKLSKPWRLHVISDSSFGSEDDDALAMRSGVIALGKKDGPRASGLQILRPESTKQTRTCRSIITADLYSALDLLVLANNINLALTEVLTGCKSARDPAAMQESGQHALQIEPKQCWMQPHHPIRSHRRINLC